MSSDTTPYQCSRCGEDTDTLHEGYCAPCCKAGQAELDLHNETFDRWEQMTDQQREDEIRRAMG